MRMIQYYVNRRKHISSNTIFVSADWVYGWVRNESYGDRRGKQDCISPPLVERVYHHFARGGFQITDTSNTTLATLMYRLV